LAKKRRLSFAKVNPKGYLINAIKSELAAQLKTEREKQGMD